MHDSQELGREVGDIAGRFAADVGALGTVAAAGRIGAGQAAAKAAEAEARAAVTSVFDLARDKGAWQWDMALGDYVPTQVPVGAAGEVAMDAVLAGGELGAGMKFLVSPGTGAWVSMSAMQQDMNWADEMRTGGDMGTISHVMTQEEIQDMLDRRELEMGEDEDSGNEALDVPEEQDDEPMVPEEQEQERQNAPGFWDWWGPFSTDD